MLIEIKEEAKQISDAETAAEIFRSILSAESEIDQDKEHFWIIGLDSKNIILYVELVAIGTLNNILVHPREVFRMAILKAAASIMVGHNHPSGSLEVSSTDRLLTERLIKAGEILGIKLLDHIVIGNNKPGCVSFHRKGLLEEDSKKIVGSNQNAKKEDILDQIADERNAVISNVYDLETLTEISTIAALENSQSKKIDWICVFSLFSRSLDAIEEKLDKMDGLITHYRHRHKENEKPEKQLSLDEKIQKVQNTRKEIMEAIGESLAS